MNRIMILVAVLFCSSVMAEMQIAEWMYSGDDGEFIRFINDGDSDVNMTGWSYADSKTSAGAVSLSAFGVVAPGESVILTEAVASTFKAAWSLSDSIKVIGGNTVNIGRSDTIKLFNASNNLVDTLVYDDQTGKGPRTQYASCIIPADDYDKTTAQSSWALSVVGDENNCRESVSGDIGNPGPVSNSAFGKMIINEYNAVGSEKYLEGTYYGDSNSVDVYFQAIADGKHPTKLTGSLSDGRIQANGSDWIELVVTKDNLDIRGWQIRWAETDSNEAAEANGTDIWYGNGNVEQGTLTFSSDPNWSNLKAGTIITIVQDDIIYVDADNGNKTFNVAPSQAEATINIDTDTSYDPCNGDWWINVSILGEYYRTNPLITSVHNVENHDTWDFGVGNDKWQAQINDANGTLVWGPVGEHLAPNGWGGSGLSSAETARVEKDPSAVITGADIEDADTSSFGMANRWGESVQNFVELRGAYKPADCYETIALGFGSKFDVDNNCQVNLTDFASFAEQWLNCFNPEDTSCQTPWFN